MNRSCFVLLLTLALVIKGVNTVTAAASDDDDNEVLSSWQSEMTFFTSEGKQVSVATYESSKAILIVNVASECGYTDSNYRELQQLYSSYHRKGLEILAFPCNQFGSQEPLDSAKVKSYVTQQYDVSFPIMAKVKVNGEEALRLFKFLKSRLPGTVTNDIKWNFTKFLLVDGKPYRRYGTTVNPMAIEADIKAALGFDEL